MRKSVNLVPMRVVEKLCPRSFKIEVKIKQY
jgi:hypothetical protein